MTKIKRDARAFAARVKMGTQRLWLIVEGKVHDMSFYDHVLADHKELDGSYSVRLAETIEFDVAKAAGGKSGVVPLFEFYRDEHLLRQSSNSGERDIAFAIDRDFDHLLGNQIVSDHVIYTQNMDVEAEILLSGDLRAATCASYSLPRAAIQSFVKPGIESATDLANMWREWITVGAASTAIGLNMGVKFARASQVHTSSGYGDLDVEKNEALKSRVEAKLQEDEDLRAPYEAAVQRVDQCYEQNIQWSLVKGKWLAGYIWYLVRLHLADEPREANVSSDTLAKSCLLTVPVHGPCAGYYKTRVDALLGA